MSCFLVGEDMIAFSSLTDLNLSNNELEIITVDFFSCFPNLQKLDLSSVSKFSIQAALFYKSQFYFIRINYVN